MPGRPPREGPRGPRPRGEARQRNEPTPPSNPVPAGNGRPPRAPRELEPDPAERRTFTADGETWVAWVAGKGAWGSGAFGLGMVDALHFARAATPERPEREALLARGRFVGLYDEELCTLLAGATPVVTEPPPRSERPRRDRRSRDW